jgi:hypothetical protein
VSNGAEKFHIDKSISYGHIITTLTLVVALIGGLITTDRRIEDNRDEIEKNSLRIAASEARVQREVDRQAADRQQMQSQMQRIEDKLDRVIENR